MNITEGHGDFPCPSVILGIVMHGLPVDGYWLAGWYTLYDIV